MVFCSYYVAVFILDISTPLVSVHLIGKMNQVILEYQIFQNCVDVFHHSMTTWSCIADCIKSSLKKFNGRYGDLTKQYEVPISRMLNEILNFNYIQWHPPPIRIFIKFWIWMFLPNLTFYRIARGFLGAFATCISCLQGTLTPPDTRPCLNWDLYVLYLLRPIHFPS